MSFIILAGVILINIALILYTVFIYKEHKYKRASKSVLIFISLAVTFDLSATISMMIGTTESYFTAHGIFGYAALFLMIIDTVLIWKHKNTAGSETPFSTKLNMYSKLAYIFWVFAFTTGVYLAMNR